jgi:hypothetical protein
MDRIFDWCVNVLVDWAAALGITYKEINVWLFVILWPLLTAGMAAVLFVQRHRIRKLERALNER